MALRTREVPPGSRRFRVVTEPASGPRDWHEDGNVRWDVTHPKAAPQFRCAGCGKWIALKRTIVLREDRNNLILCILCVRCDMSGDAHAKWYPDCPERWHDTGDHHAVFCTRAGLAARLGIWP